ncbi:hypothetical protein H4R34_003719 [Dimargaris verticillata]|uniref:General transcription and DNA repair factor IIH subunit TFB5 n=1 Tax=Dimargaris verticillata TaxID=2761393 RepID=A0A9W8B066_9FUNG|nr:hypothetical protein H4R34_003719 [Dimargaris verticillata]KAJ1979072.1 hypothetical protein H4R35_001656 [Dimargaris xerosporica]KAJ1979726.1 hypothetical protein H4R35_001404 [Dimargaris xerosporica]
MVSATKGVLIECDTTAKQVILNLDERYHFIIEDLDSTHLFVNSDCVRMLQSELDKIIDENTFKVDGFEKFVKDSRV